MDDALLLIHKTLGNTLGTLGAHGERNPAYQQGRHPHQPPCEVAHGGRVADGDLPARGRRGGGDLRDCDRGGRKPMAHGWGEGGRMRRLTEAGRGDPPLRQLRPSPDREPHGRRSPQATPDPGVGEPHLPDLRALRRPLDPLREPGRWSPVPEATPTPTRQCPFVEGEGGGTGQAATATGRGRRPSAVGHPRRPGQ